MSANCGCDSGVVLENEVGLDSVDEDSKVCKVVLVLVESEKLVLIGYLNVSVRKDLFETAWKCAWIRAHFGSELFQFGNCDLGSLCWACQTICSLDLVDQLVCFGELIFEN